ARRDGFEETKEWSLIRNSLINNVCDGLAKEAYEASKAGQIDVKKVAEDIDKLAEQSHRLADNSKATYDQVVDLMNSAKRLRRRALAATKFVDDLDDTSVEMGQPKEALAGATLQEAVQNVETVET